METLPAGQEGMHTLAFPTFSASVQRCRLSRRYGGIHPESGDYAGRGLVRQVAPFVWGTAANRRPSSGRTR
jgi:hypothetical protein